MRQRKPASMWFQLAAIGLQFALVAPQALADPEAIVKVSCDRAKGELRIDENVEDTAEDSWLPRAIAPGAMTFSVSGLVEVKEVDGGFTWEDRPIQRECRLGSDIYVAEFRGRKANYNTQGECGGNPETLSLTMKRNGQALFKELVLHDSCRAPHEIGYIRFVNSTKEVVAMVSAEFTDERREVRVPMNSKITRASILDAAWPTASH